MASSPLLSNHKYGVIVGYSFIQLYDEYPTPLKT